jgi:hypothetical protein
MGSTRMCRFRGGICRGDVPDCRFRYFADPACIAALAVYALNRHVLKPHHIGGWFTHGYLNDVLCLPLFVPMILYAQRLLKVRRHDGYPRFWEIAQQWAIFAVMFQAIIPRFPGIFISAGDPWDMLAYAAGGIIAGIYWRSVSRRCPESLVRRDNDRDIPAGNTGGTHHQPAATAAAALLFASTMTGWLN